MDDNSLDTHTSREHRIDIDVDAHIADLADRQAWFSGYIDRRWHDLSVRQLARVLAAHGRNGVRLGELLRDRRALGGLGQPPVSIDAVIADLGDKWGRLSRDIDERWPEMDSENVKPWCRLMMVHSQNCVRLGQLMRAWRDLREERSSDEFDAALDAALAQLGEEGNRDLRFGDLRFGDLGRWAKHCGRDRSGVVNP